MNRSFARAGAACAVALVLAAASPAGAQQLGTYSGTLPKGGTISFEVVQDPATGALAIGQVDVVAVVHCKRTGEAQNEAIHWAVGSSGINALINDGRASVELRALTYFTHLNISFLDNGASGTTQTGFAEYTNVDELATQSCNSKVLDFQATAGAPMAARAAGQHVHRVDAGDRVAPTR